MKLTPYAVFEDGGAAPVFQQNNPDGTGPDTGQEQQHRPAPQKTSPIKPAGTKKPTAGGHGLNAGTAVSPTAGGLRQAMRQDAMHEAHTVTARELSKRLQRLLNVNRQQADRMAVILLT
jgi:hypothetical protein